MLKDRTILQDKWSKMAIFGASKQRPDLEMTHRIHLSNDRSIYHLFKRRSRRKLFLNKFEQE